MTFLGTGSAFCQRNFQTNMLIEFDSGYRLLVDCGGDVRFSLEKLGMSYLDINGVYVSHLHADHIGGMEYIAFCTYFDHRYQGFYPCSEDTPERRPDLFISEFLVDDLWNRSLSGGLGSLQNKRATLETYFDVHAIEKNGSFQIGRAIDSTRFRLVQVVHFVNGFTFELSFGLMFKAGEETVFLTTDTQHAPNQIQDFYNEATIIFHDTETSQFPSGVHAHFDELCELDEKTRSKMHLVHYQDNVLEEHDHWKARADKAGFRGFVMQGTTFAFEE
jgi:ribonuclease BN (tRNA processing enzyme)